jgi:hypothetical protein
VLLVVDSPHRVWHILIMVGTRNNKERKMKNEITVKTSRGTVISVVSGLKLTKNVNLDGHICSVQCCEKIFEVTLNGKYHSASELSTIGYPRKIQGHTVYGALGECLLTDEYVVERIKALVAKTETHPAWIERKAKIAQSLKTDNEYERHVKRIKKAMDF